MPCKTLTSNDIRVVVTAFPEEIPVKGNAICSGDEDFDRQVESEILKRLEQDDVWAWATVCVSAEWEALKENEYLGCCCYESEEDFRNNSGYFEEMVDEVLANLNKRIQNLYKKWRYRQKPKENQSCPIPKKDQPLTNCNVPAVATRTASKLK